MESDRCYSLDLSVLLSPRPVIVNPLGPPQPISRVRSTYTAIAVQYHNHHHPVSNHSPSPSLHFLQHMTSSHIVPSNHSIVRIDQVRASRSVMFFTTFTYTLQACFDFQNRFRPSVRPFLASSPIPLRVTLFRNQILFRIFLYCIYVQEVFYIAYACDMIVHLIRFREWPFQWDLLAT